MIWPVARVFFALLAPTRLPVVNLHEALAFKAP